MRRYFQVQLAMLTREIADVVLVKDVDGDVDFDDIMHEGYDQTDGTEFRIDVDWGCDEGTHFFVGELTEESANNSSLKKIELKKEE